jgi:hypothetical protein
MTFSQVDLTDSAGIGRKDKACNKTKHKPKKKETTK